MESNSLIHTYPCGDKKCVGTAIPLAKEGRFYYHPKHVPAGCGSDWLRILIPADFEVHRCNVCDVDWLFGDNKRKIPEYLEASYLEHAKLIGKVVDDFRAAQKKALKDEY